jgi:hypothetical protein
MTSEQMMMGMMMITSDATQDIRHNTNKNEKGPATIIDFY